MVVRTPKVLSTLLNNNFKITSRFLEVIETGLMVTSKLFYLLSAAKEAATRKRLSAALEPVDQRSPYFTYVSRVRTVSVHAPEDKFMFSEGK